ncbi:MAG TPA: TonB-dependent receptor [Candidatus Acidoferrales bacterium]|nr:TonB-dependent receptor [Candidatus Acidoferrales bacterium]
MSSKNSMHRVSSGGWCGYTINFLAVTFGVLLLSLPAFSQGNAGRISGTVTDQSGGVVANATVSVVDTARNISRSLTTDDAGEYNAPNLTPSTYTVSAEAKGFKRIERQNVELGVGKEVRVDLQVQPGAQEQTVTVTEAVPLVETTNATLGGTLDNADIVDMPLNGRNYQSLLALRPGVMIQPGGGPWTQSTNGVRPDESVWLVDGIINSNFFDSRSIAGMSSPITDGATILPIDSIQEFNTMENPKAEYGWKPGAVVNVGVKSGTNQLHGSAYGFYRSAAWDGRNFFNPGPLADGSCLLGAASLCAKLPTQLKQFGGSVGGPIKKDKLFFFANYEGLRDLLGNALVGSGGGIAETVAQPTPDPADSIVDAINAIVAANGAGAVSPVSLKLAGCTLGATPSATACTGSAFFPANTNTTGHAGTAFISNLPNTNVSDNGVGKIDYHINDKNTLNGLFIIGNYTGSGEDHPFVTSAFLDNFLIRTYTASGNWDYTPNSSMVNEVRFGYNRMQYSITTDDAGLTDPINTGLSVQGLPNLYISGFNFIGTWHNRPQSETPNPYYDFQDAFSYLKGKHAFKFGYEYTHIEADSNIPNYGRGRVNFKGGQTPNLTDCKGASCPLEDFFAGNPDGGTVLVGNNSREMTWSNNALFAQDDWRITPKVILNLGMRWAYESPLSAANNLWANFDPTSATGITQQGTPGNGTMWKPDYHDFSPRVGFAWDVTGKGDTVVRGGFSIMYSSFSAVQWMNQNDFQNDNSVTLAANPTGASIVSCPASCLSSGVPVTIAPTGNILAVAKSVSPTNGQWNGVLFPPQSASCGDGVTPPATVLNPTPTKDPGTCDLMGVDPNLRTPYIMNFNFGIQHQFGSNYSLEIGYVGNRGERLVGFADVNQTNPATGIQPYAIQYPWLNFINVMSNDVHSNYNSLQATLTKRLSHGLSFIAGYTYAHGLDDGSLNRFGLLPQNAQDIGAEYGSSDFDVRHRLTITATYNIPGIKGFAQLLEGWQVNTIVNLQSAQPWTINDTSDNFSVNGKGDLSYRWNFMGDPSNFRSGANSLPYCSGPTNCVQTSAVYGNAVINNFSAAQDNTMWNQCLTADQAAPGNTLPSNLASLGCFVNGNAVMTPPHTGTFGDMGRNIFRDSGFKDMDFSVFKNFTWKERYNAQFRLEIFNLFNHPIPANPYGASNGFNTGNDPSAGAGFGGSPSTPDGAAGNPIVGSGAARDVQVGLKITF